MRDTEKDIGRLLEQIDIIYADFGYPEDMEKFITYMPSNDEYNPLKHKLEDNRYYLLSKLDDFINEKMKEYQLERVM